MIYALSRHLIAAADDNRRVAERKVRNLGSAHRAIRAALWLAVLLVVRLVLRNWIVPR